MNDLRNLPDDELIDRAVRAYWNWRRLSHPSPEQPNVATSEVRDGHVYLANVNGIRATYRVGRQRLIRVHGTR